MGVPEVVLGGQLGLWGRILDRNMAGVVSIGSSGLSPSAQVALEILAAPLSPASQGLVSNSLSA